MDPESILRQAQDMVQDDGVEVSAWFRLRSTTALNHRAQQPSWGACPEERSDVRVSILESMGWGSRSERSLLRELKITPHPALCYNNRLPLLLGVFA